MSEKPKIGPMTAQARMTEMATMKAPADPAISEVICAIEWKKSFIVGTFLRDSYTHERSLRRLQLLS